MQNRRTQAAAPRKAPPPRGGKGELFWVPFFSKKGTYQPPKYFSVSVALAAPFSIA